MADMKLFIELLARSSGLKTGLDDSGRAVNRFAQGARRELDTLKRAAGSLGGKLAALGLSFGAMQQLSQSAQLDKGLTQIKQTAGAATDEIKGLRQEFFSMSRQTGQDIENLKGGFDALIQSGLTWRASLESTRGINIAKAVTGSDATVLAKGLTVGAEQFRIDLEKPGQALETLDKMTVAGRLGSAELENLSDIFARAGSSAREAQLSFDKTLAFIEALSAVEKQPERLATLTESTLRVFTNLRYMAEAQKGTGIQFFATDGSRRDPVAILKDIKARWDTLKSDKDRAVFIQKAFGKADLDTIKGIRTLLQGNALNNIESFTQQIGNAGGTLQRDLPDAVNNAVDQAGRLKAVLRQAADEFAQPINKTFADIIQFGLGKKANGGLELTGKELVGGTAAIMGGSYLAARLGNGIVKRLAGRFLRGVGGTAAGVAEGKALQAAAGVTPVFVTNWPAGGVGSGVVDAITGAAGAAGAGKVLPLAKRMIGALATMAPAAELAAVGGAAVGGFAVGSWIEKRFIKGAIGEAIYDMFHAWEDPKTQQKMDELKALKNDIKIDINIDALGRITTNANGMNNKVNTMKRGSFFDAMTTTAGMGY